jgi:hypothetical protein
MQLQAAYGDVGVKLQVELQAGAGPAAAANGAAAMLCSTVSGVACGCRVGRAIAAEGGVAWFASGQG